MLRWEIAVAAVGSVLGVHPFDQPDVQLAKDLARDAMAGGGGEAEPPVAAGGGELAGRLEELLAACGPGCYVAVQAYLAPEERTTAKLLRLRHELARRTGCAATVAYGPRFLHSTGQLHKGGPPTGLFLQLVDRPAVDLPVPGTDATFGGLIAGQAEGDRRALAQRQRRVLAVDLGADPLAALEGLAEAVGAASPAAV
jgi:transaldolase/glucose-6-phosphate isomerase